MIVGGETVASDSPSQDKPVTSQVLYLTNRLKSEGRNGSLDYTGDRGVPAFGYCEVEFTPIPFAEDIAEKLPFYVKSETNKVSMHDLDGSDTFWEMLDTALNEDPASPVVLFIHGYNYGFSRNCDMAAEIQRMLHDKATVIMFSWPSNGTPADYVSDIADMEWSVPLLAGFIDQLGQRVGPDRLRILAHSMGSRGAIFSLVISNCS